MGTPDVVLLVTGSLNGALEPGADGKPAALARRAGLVQRYRAAFPRVVLVDTGDAFRADPHDARNRLVVRAHREIGYDAMVLGPHEWTMPLRDLRAWLQPGDLAWLSTIVAPKDEPRLPLAREVKREWGDRRLAVVSDLRRDGPLLLPRRKLDELAFTPPDRLRERVAALEAAGYAVVAVAHGGDEQVEKTARGCEARLILQGHVATSGTALREVAGRRVARVGGAGHVGVLALKLRGNTIAAVEYRLEAVDDRWPADRRLLATSAAYAKAPRRKPPATERTEGLAYVAPSACADCHSIEFAAWKKRRHAHAFATLEQSGRAKDRQCLACHTTGFTTTGGFHSREQTPDLAGVGCQVCHRFELDEHGGGGFSGYPPDEETCRECHTKLTDPGFDFEKRRNHVGCVAK